MNYRWLADFCNQVSFARDFCLSSRNSDVHVVSLRRRLAAKPRKPMPSSASEAGSGTAACPDVSEETEPTDWAVETAFENIICAFADPITGRKPLRSDVINPLGFAKPPQSRKTKYASVSGTPFTDPE
jgi:hypothetical protein